MRKLYNQHTLCRSRNTVRQRDCLSSRIVVFICFSAQSFRLVKLEFSVLCVLVAVLQKCFHLLVLFVFLFYTCALFTQATCKLCCSFPWCRWRNLANTPYLSQVVCLCEETFFSPRCAFYLNVYVWGLLCITFQPFSRDIVL